MKLLKLCSFLLAATLALAGCNGAVTSASFPSASPWETLMTGLLSPTDDLVAVGGGAGFNAELLDGAPPGFPLSYQAVVACGGAEPSLKVCSDRMCDAQTECDTDPVIEKRFVYTLFVELDRDIFTTGSVQLQDGSGATQLGLAVRVGGTGGSFDVAAGLSEGLIPGQQFDDDEFNVGAYLDDLGSLFLAPSWDDFDDGAIGREVCVDGVCTDQIIGACFTGTESLEDFDVLGFLAQAEPGTYSGMCGQVPVNLTVNPPFATVGQCISQRKASACSGLTGQDRKTCNHAQIGICHATFNIPSAHNN